MTFCSHLVFIDWNEKNFFERLNPEKVFPESDFQFEVNELEIFKPWHRSKVFYAATLEP